jgi:hypothetical protein
MESNALNPAAEAGIAQANTPSTSTSAWSAPRAFDQPGQAPQVDEEDGASMRQAMDADSVGRESADTTPIDLRAVVTGVLQAGKAYAQDAVNAAGQKIDSLKDQAGELRQRGSQFAAEEPMKAMAYAAAGGAALAALLLSLRRDGHR